MTKEVASSCHIGIGQSMKIWIEKMGKIIANIPPVNNELLGKIIANIPPVNNELLVLDGVSEEAGIDQCEQYIGVEKGTIEIKEDIIHCISYDAAIHALDLSSGSTSRTSISQYYKYHLQPPIQLAWSFVCKSISSATDNICERSALLLIGITKTRSTAYVDRHQFFRCRTFREVYNLLHKLGKFLLQAWENDNSVKASVGKRIRLNRMRLYPTPDRVESFLSTIGGPLCGSTTDHQKKGQKKRGRTSQSSNKDDSVMDHTGDSNTCDHEADSSSESSITDSPSPDQNYIAYRSRDSPHNRIAIEHNEEVEQAAEYQAGSQEHSSGCSDGECSNSRTVTVSPPLNELDNSRSPSNRSTDAIKGKPPSSNHSRMEIENVLSYEGLIRMLPTAHANRKNELEMSKDDWMAFVNSRPVAEHFYDILSR